MAISGTANRREKVMMFLSSTVSPDHEIARIASSRTRPREAASVATAFANGSASSRDSASLRLARPSRSISRVRTPAVMLAAIAPRPPRIAFSFGFLWPAEATAATPLPLDLDCSAIATPLSTERGNSPAGLPNAERISSHCTDPH
jgi:hypothetical protein